MGELQRLQDELVKAEVLVLIWGLIWVFSLIWFLVLVLFLGWGAIWSLILPWALGWILAEVSAEVSRIKIKSKHWKKTLKIQHSLLRKAKTNKNDEFYTQLLDIESELKNYKNHFKDKVIFCNCDDARVSNFFNYFVLNFKELGIKKLISASYRKQEINTLRTEEVECGFFYEYANTEKEIRKPSSSDIIYFKGDGDFRSSESIELLKQSDIVVTNPPFSLFREYVNQLVEYDKKFLIIGNINAITYKEIFKLIKENKAWLGINLGRGISGFIVPDYYELYGTETRINSNGNRVVSPNNCLWLTNLDTSKRHEDIILTKKYLGSEIEYPKYDNYNGININKTKDIPLDYKGFMGVPITFLHKFNPDQFEIIKFRKGDDEKDLSINGKCPYFRIIIRNKRIAVKLDKATAGDTATKTKARISRIKNKIAKIENSDDTCDD